MKRPNGDYIQYDDHEAIVKKLQNELDSLCAQIEGMCVEDGDDFDGMTDSARKLLTSLGYPLSSSQ